jgi:meiotically up-regulated gene 157 (Mug157) protein
MTSDDDTEISDCLKLVLQASRLGLVHESINVNMIYDYTSKSRMLFRLEIVANHYSQGAGLLVR